MENEDIIIEMLKGKRESDMQSLFLSIEHKLKQADRPHQLIMDIEDFFLTNSFKKNLVHFLNRNSEEGISVAFCGAGKGVRKVILQSIDYPLYIAEDMDDAIDWLKG